MTSLLAHIRLPFFEQFGGIVSPFVVVVSIMFIIKLLTILIKELQKTRQFSKTPGLPAFSPLYLLLGNIEVVYLFFNNIPRPKALFRLLETMFNISSMRDQGYFSFTVGFDRMVACFHESTVEELITSSIQIDKSVEYSFFNDWLGLGLLTSTGGHWKLHRKLLTPAFHFKILDSFGPTMNENVTEMLDVIGRDIKKQDNLKEGLDIRPYITNCTLDTICETAMGTRVGAQSGDLEYATHINKTLELILNRIMTPTYRINLFWKFSAMKRRLDRHLREIHTFVGKVIDDRREEMKQNISKEHLDMTHLNPNEILGNKKRYAFLDSLLVAHFQNPKMFTTKDIMDEVNTFMFEGHDTTSAALVFTLLMIAEDQRVQDKIYDELMSVLHDDPQRPIGIEDSRQLKYLEMVIKEGLRLYPPVPFHGRQLTEPLNIKGQTIPAGSMAVIVGYLLHRDAENFPQPEKFLPERWEPEASIHKRPYAYMPFSAGPRNCIGQKFAILELKIVIGSVVRRFHMKAISNRLDIDIDFRVLIKANSPVKIHFEPRE